MKTAVHTNLLKEILALIGRGVEVPTSDEEFNDLALRIFAFQFEHNAIYRAWCESRQQTPPIVRHWKRIPAVPTSAFKDCTLACFPIEEAVAVFYTSGTTQSKPGRHYFKTLQLYDAAILPNFQAHLLPDEKRVRLIVLTPSPEEAPHSSLSHMMEVVWTRMKDELGKMKEGNPFYIRNEKLEVERLALDLRAAEQSNQPVMLLGTAFAFVHLFEFCEREGRRFTLPRGSRAMETGGFKGRSRAMSKQELYSLFGKFLGLSASQIVNEYGMTELSTQFYDETRRVGKQSDLKNIPPWSRVLIIDPRTGQEVRAGERGLIRVVDLANLFSAAVIQTEDWGVAKEGGFEVIGRATMNEARGCSIAADELLSR